MEQAIVACIRHQNRLLLGKASVRMSQEEGDEMLGTCISLGRSHLVLVPVLNLVLRILKLATSLQLQC